MHQKPFDVRANRSEPGHRTTEKTFCAVQPVAFAFTLFD